MAWIIDIDHNPDPARPEGTNANAKGIRSYLDYSGDYPYKFKMYDDDGELYYTGRSSVPDSFAPL